MQSNDNSLIYATRDINASLKSSESIILQEDNVTPSTQDSFPSYSVRKILETSTQTLTNSERHINKIVGNGSPFALPLECNVTLDRTFRSPTVNGDWIFALSYNNTIVAYKRHKEMWRLSFNAYTYPKKVVYASENQIVMHNERSIVTFRNGVLTRYFTDFNDVILSVTSLYEQLFLVLRKRTFPTKAYCISIVSNTGVDLQTQSVSAITSISTFNDGILILYKSLDGTGCQLKWYTKTQTLWRYKTQYSRYIKAKRIEVSIHDKVLMLTIGYKLIFLNTHLEVITEIHSDFHFLRGLIYDNKITVYYVLYGKAFTIGFISTQCSEVALKTGADIATYSVTVDSSPLGGVFGYADSMLVMDEKRIYILSTRWSKRNNFLQSKNNQGVIRTLYTMQHHGALSVPKEILDIIVTLAFSTTP